MLKKMSDMYQVDIDDLKAALPVAEKRLYNRLVENIDVRGEFL